MAAISWQFSKASKKGWRPQNVSSSAATGAARTLISAPGAGYRIVIDEFSFNVDTADALLNVYVTSDETGNRMIYHPLSKNSGIANPIHWEPKALPENAALLATVSAGNVYYVIWYHIEPVR